MSEKWLTCTQCPLISTPVQYTTAINSTFNEVYNVHFLVTLLLMFIIEVVVNVKAVWDFIILSSIANILSFLSTYTRGRILETPLNIIQSRTTPPITLIPNDNTYLTNINVDLVENSCIGIHWILQVYLLKWPLSMFQYTVSILDIEQYKGHKPKGLFCHSMP